MPDIKGYRNLTPHEVELINSIKDVGTTCQDLIIAITRTQEADLRWVNIAQTHLQQGLMALTRAVAKPTNF